MERGGDHLGRLDHPVPLVVLPSPPSRIEFRQSDKIIFM